MGIDEGIRVVALCAFVVFIAIVLTRPTTGGGDIE
jgi:hypothetical protein